MRDFHGNVLVRQQDPVVVSGDATLSQKEGLIHLTKGTAAAITLPPPKAGSYSAGGDDGKELTFISETAAAHVITCSDGFNAKGSSGTATLAAAKGNGVTVRARNGHWWVAINVGATLA